MLVLIAAIVLSVPFVGMGRFLRLVLAEGFGSAFGYLSKVGVDALDKSYAVIATAQRHLTFSSKLYLEDQQRRLTWIRKTVDWCWGWREHKHCRNAAMEERGELRITLSVLDKALAKDIDLNRSK